MKNLTLSQWRRVEVWMVTQAWSYASLCFSQVTIRSSPILIVWLLRGDCHDLSSQDGSWKRCAWFLLLPLLLKGHQQTPSDFLKPTL
jgi:hypothetical protein